MDWGVKMDFAIDSVDDAILLDFQGSKGAHILDSFSATCTQGVDTDIIEFGVYGLFDSVNDLGEEARVEFAFKNGVLYADAKLFEMFGKALSPAIPGWVAWDVIGYKVIHSSWPGHWIGG